jgi:predicted negative regulator of RcsB-dependent stress response
MDVARQRQLVWCRPDGVTCVFLHDKIRRALIDRWPPAELKSYHLRAAHYYKNLEPDRISELAYHFDAAGASEQAFYYALEAAEQARSRYALETAEQQYEIARRGAASRVSNVQYRVAEGLGDVLMLRGKYDAAGELFDEAEKVATSNFTQAQIRGKLAELSFKRGDMERAVQAYEEALRSVNCRIPTNRVILFVWMIWEVLVQVFHSLFPTLFVHRLKRPPTESERLTIRLFSGLAHGCWYSRGCLNTLWAHLRGLNLAERFRPRWNWAMPIPSTPR